MQEEINPQPLSPVESSVQPDAVTPIEQFVDEAERFSQALRSLRDHHAALLARTPAYARVTAYAASLTFLDRAISEIERAENEHLVPLLR